MTKANEPGGTGGRTAGELAKAAEKLTGEPVGGTAAKAAAGKNPGPGGAGAPSRTAGGPRPGPANPRTSPAGPASAGPKPGFGGMVSGTLAPKPMGAPVGASGSKSAAPAGQSAAVPTAALPSSGKPAATTSATSRTDGDATAAASAADVGERAAVRHIPATSTIGTPLRAAVQVRRVDPWSIFKVSGILSIVGFLIWMIAIAVLYGVLAGMGIWDQINSSFGTLVSADGSSDSGNLISAGQVFGFSALFGIFAAIVLTALSTILAYVYNVCADVVGGVEVTLADLD